ncbi:MAG: nucleotidyltransferase family protein [Sediminibacterium sp.]
MRAILLAAGLGTRLRPLTDTIPKCLVPIKGKPLLQIWLEHLSEAGVDSFLVNTHYLSGEVQKFIAGSIYHDRIIQVHENELLGTAGTLMANMDFFEGEDGMLIHADNYCLADFREFIEVHRNRPAECIMTMMTFQTQNPSSCGIVELDEKNIVQGFHEKVANPPGNLANGAVYIFSNDLLKLMYNDFPKASDFSTEVLPHLTGRIYSYETKETFIDIGTPETYAKANS